MAKNNVFVINIKFFKIYDSEGNVYQDICLHDLGVLIRLFF